MTAKKNAFFKETLEKQIEGVDLSKCVNDLLDDKPVTAENLRQYIKDYEFSEDDMVVLDYALDDCSINSGNILIKLPVDLLEIARTDKSMNWVVAVFFATQMIRNKKNKRYCTMTDILRFFGYSENTKNYKKVRESLVFLKSKNYASFSSNDQPVNMRKIGRSDLFATYGGYNKSMFTIDITSKRVEYILQHSKGINLMTFLNVYFCLYYWTKYVPNKEVLLGTVEFFREELGVMRNSVKLKLLKRYLELDLMYAITGGNIIKKGKFMSTPYFLSLGNVSDFVIKTQSARDRYCYSAQLNGCKVYSDFVDTHCIDIDVEYKRNLSKFRQERYYAMRKDADGFYNFEEISKIINTLKQRKENRVKRRQEEMENKKNPAFGSSISVDVEFIPRFLSEQQIEALKNKYVKKAVYTYKKQ